MTATTDRVSGVVAGVRDTANSTLVLEFLLGLCTPFLRTTIPPGMPLEIPLMLAVVALCSLRRAPYRVKHVEWIVLVFGLVVAHTVAVSIMNEEPWVQRAGRIVLLVLTMVCIAEGRLDWQSFVAGACFGLFFINVPGYYLGLSPDRYPPFLTGWLNDKNVAGMYYAIFGCLGLVILQSRVMRGIFVLLSAGLIALTGSRTSFTAYGMAILWLLIRARVTRWGRVALLVAGVYALRWLEDLAQENGWFSDRADSDWFRAQIEQQVAIKLDQTPWFGAGFNTAWVDVTSFPHMWFHDSYAALLVEGGWPMLIGVLAIIGLGGLGLLSTTAKVTRGQRCAEAALVASLVCAWKLGEVFFTFPVLVIALGVALHERLAAPVDRPWATKELENAE